MAPVPSYGNASTGTNTNRTNTAPIRIGTCLPSHGYGSNKIKKYLHKGCYKKIHQNPSMRNIGWGNRKYTNPPLYIIATWRNHSANTLALLLPTNKGPVKKHMKILTL